MLQEISFAVNALQLLGFSNVLQNGLKIWKHQNSFVRKIEMIFLGDMQKQSLLIFDRK